MDLWRFLLTDKEQMNKVDLFSSMSWISFYIGSYYSVNNFFKILPVHYIRLSKISERQLMNLLERISMCVSSVQSGDDRLCQEDGILQYHYENVIFTEVYFSSFCTSTKGLFWINSYAKSLTSFIKKTSFYIMDVW